MTDSPEFRTASINGVAVLEFRRGSRGYLLLEAMEQAIAAERERAARIAETKQLHPLDEARLLVERPDFVEGYRDSGLDIAAAIREDS